MHHISKFNINIPHHYRPHDDQRLRKAFIPVKYRIFYSEFENRPTTFLFLLDQCCKRHFP